MSQSLQLIAELKRQLKLHGKSYQHVAQVLNLSEASVKRLFEYYVNHGLPVLYRQLAKQ